MKISKGTIIRTILMILIIVNLVLKQMGHDVINISDSQVEQIVETLIEISTILACWWKNNSFTSKAIKADQLLKKMRSEE